MGNLQTDNKFISLLIGLVAFFILVFITTNIYTDMQLNFEENKINKEKLEKLDTKLVRLGDLKIKLENKESADSIKVKKFTAIFSEDRLFSYLKSHIEDVNKDEVFLSLNSISFSEEKKSELGFKQINIDLKMEVSDKFVLNNFIDFLVSDNNEYGFFITELNFPIEKSGPYKINIPLKMYIK